MDAEGMADEDAGAGMDKEAEAGLCFLVVFGRTTCSETMDVSPIVLFFAGIIEAGGGRAPC